MFVRFINKREDANHNNASVQSWELVKVNEEGLMTNPNPNVCFFFLNGYGSKFIQ